MTHNAENGLHPCAGCGVELDADDYSDLCDECSTPWPPTRVFPPGTGDANGVGTPNE